MLTKSDLQSFRQCPRKLWLEHHKPELISADDPTLYRRTIDGNIVGEKAREQLGKDFIWPPKAESYPGTAEIARSALANAPTTPAAEVPMINGNLYARADALIPAEGGYILRETKASTFPLKTDKITPAEPKEHHVEDVAIQAWTMEGAGIAFVSAELNLLDNQWRYPGGEDYSGLFKQLDITAEVQNCKTQVPIWLRDAEAVIAGGMPEVVTGRQCSEPYSCPFLSHCEKLDPLGPEHPIELLPDAAGKNLARKLRDTKGYTSILDPKPNELTGKQAALYQRIQIAHRTGKAVLESGSDAILTGLNYPRYYFDFEGIDLPVPRWVGVRPYEQIPFQWSCHIERSPGQFEHAEFLDLSGNDPSLGCIQRMRDMIDPDDEGPILVYYSTYERQRMQELGKRHPEHADLMQRYIDRLFDLHPVVKEFFYHPMMRGSFSIKKVLPVIAPNLDYRELGEIQEGTGAQVAYLYATFDPNSGGDRKTELEVGLRKYCRQDTWAMVEVAYFLARMERPRRPAET